ncbi:MAG: hypothetical protein IIA00_03380 [Proteobacteria bacterium]|nr:hypothetical protein [Pseudomonadota bacterium]
MPVQWQDYLTVPGGKAVYCECHRRCRGAFERQREIIGSVLDKTNPNVVACLGAGILNDIPYRRMVRSGATIHLVDWLPGITDAGIDWSIIERDEDGAARCVFCTLSEDRSAAYCRRFTGDGGSDAEVCGSFVAGKGSPFLCTAFEKGTQPICHTADVTGGYASAFAERVLDAVGDARSWKSAFGRAIALANRVSRQRTNLGIPDASVDLVTSSMLVSQFDHEPYDYFSWQVAEVLGPPTAKEERRLEPAVQRLRATLRTNQFDGHCDEIERILAPGGYCFMSFEMFVLDAAASRWILVKEMHEVLGLLARRFSFAFDILPEHELFARFVGQKAASVVCSLVLQARGG